MTSISHPDRIEFRGFSLATVLFVAIQLLFSGAVAQAGFVSVTQNSVPSLDALPPQIEATPLGEEAFAFVDRTHELTSARYNPTTGLLTTDAAIGVLVGFPSYLIGAQYVANANDNRAAGTSAAQSDYVVTYTVDIPMRVYLLLDNRLNGTASNWSDPNTDDPNLGGNLVWVIDDGWVRVNTGIMPNGQADYIGIDEGGTVSGPAARTHHDPGAGVSLNQFYAIYSKVVQPGTFVTRGVKQASGNGNMYVVAAVPAAPPPAPTNVTVLNLDASVRLAWSGSGSATSYNVKRSDTSGGPYTAVATTADLFYLDTTVVNGNSYFYVITALGAAGESDNSTEVTGQPNVAPTNLAAVGGRNQITLTWDALAEAASYIVKRSENSNGPYVTVASGVAAPTYTDSGLPDGWNYFYRVSAVLSGGGEGGNSNEAEGLTAPGTPTNVSASLFAATVIKLSWSSADRVKPAIQIEQSTDGGMNWVPLALLPAGTSTYYAANLVASVTYRHRITAGNATDAAPAVETGDVTTPVSGIDINFANAINGTPANNPAPTPPGYLQDVGEVYGLHFGVNYGWDADNTVHSRWRQNPASPDLRYDTFNHLQKPLPAGRSWSIGLPVDYYLVHVVGGDPDNTDSVLQFDIEGQITPTYTPTTTARFCDFTVTVFVSDGILTIMNGPSASNNKICFVNIYPTIPQPNTFGDQPQDQTVLENRPVSFSVTVTGGSMPYGLQWFFNDVAIEGATAASYSIPLPQTTNAGLYYVVANNVAYSATSRVATLIVNEDMVGPTLLSATRDCSQTNITLVFDEVLSPTSAADPFLFYITNLTDGVMDDQIFRTTTLGPDGKTVLLTTTTPVTNGVQYALGVYYAEDLAGNGSLDQEVPLVLKVAFTTSGPDNLVSLEAENADEVVRRVWENVERTWLFATERPGFSGTGSMRAMPNTEGNRPTGNEAASLDFCVNFPTAGTYYLWVRGGSEAGGDNSCHGGLDGVVPDTAINITQGFELPGDGYAWCGTKDGGTAPGRTTLGVGTPGVHKVQVYMREDGFYCDKILLTLDANYNPATVNGGLGPDQSPKESTDVVIRLSIKLTAEGQVEISWNRGTLMEATSLDGQWTPLNQATSPWQVTPTPGETKFYKAVLSP